MKNKHYIIIIVLVISLLGIVKQGLCQNPNTPSILSVEVVPSETNPGQVKITSNQPEDDIWAYKFHKRHFNAGGGYNDLSFPADPHTDVPYVFDEEGEADIKSEVYLVQIIVMDEDGNRRYSLLSDPVSTIFLDALQYDTCAQRIELNWTPFTGLNDVPNQYKVMRKFDEQEFEVLHTTTDTFFVYENIPEGYNYSLYIELESSYGFKSNSNTRTQYVALPPAPDSNLQYIYNVAVNGDVVTINSQVDTMVEVGNYALFSNDSIDGYYDLVQKITADSSGIISYNVESNNPQHYYRMQTMGLCDVYVDTTNTVQPITLAMDQKDADVTLNWHESYSAAIQENYTLLTVIDGVPADDLEFAAGLFSTQLDLNEIGNDQSEIFEFRVKATSDKDYISFSNVVIASRLPIITLPEAFTPNGDGTNDIIGPFNKVDGEGEYAYFKNADVPSFQDFYIVIYDRYGGAIFEATDISRFWDGSFGAYYVNEGTYPYYLKFTTGLDRTIEHQGVFIVVYP